MEADLSSLSFSSDYLSFTNSTMVNDESKFPCVKCNGKVTDKHKLAVMCGICQKWKHQNCFTNKREHEAATKETLWTCSDECAERLPVSKQLYSISDPSTADLFKMMKGLTLHSARNEYWRSHEFTEMKDRIEKVEENIADLNTVISRTTDETKNTCAQLDVKMNKEITDLRKQIDRLTNDKNERTAIIVGLKLDHVVTAESLTEYFRSFGIMVKFIKGFAIKNKKPATPNIRADPILVEFYSTSDKSTFYKDIKKCKEVPNSNLKIRMRDYLTGKKQELFSEAKIALKNYFEYIWHKNGIIYAKRHSDVAGEAEKPFLINDSETILQLVKEGESNAVYLLDVAKQNLCNLFSNIFLWDGKVYVSNSPDKNIENALWIKNLEDIAQQNPQFNKKK